MSLSVLCGGSMGFGARYWGPFGPCMNGAGVWFAFPAINQTCSSPFLFLIFMNQRAEGVGLGCLRIASLLFTVLASSIRGLQHALGRFADECEATGMRISTSKSEVMVLSQKLVDCHFRSGRSFCPKGRSLSIPGLVHEWGLRGSRGGQTDWLQFCGRLTILFW